MPKERRKRDTPQKRSKAPVAPITEEKKLEAIAIFSDEVISKLADAFFEVYSKEGWTKRDLALISGINETAISHILSGRRLNPTIETVALLSRAMRRRPVLNLVDLRPKGNGVERISRESVAAATSATNQFVVAAPKASHDTIGTLRAYQGNNFKSLSQTKAIDAGTSSTASSKIWRNQIEPED